MGKEQREKWIYAIFNRTSAGFIFRTSTKILAANSIFYAESHHVTLHVYILDKIKKKKKKKNEYKGHSTNKGFFFVVFFFIFS